MFGEGPKRNFVRKQIWRRLYALLDVWRRVRGVPPPY